MKFLLIVSALISIVAFSRWLDSGKDNTERCELLAHDTYRERLTEALADPTLWQFAGDSSAQEYAKRSANLMQSICIKMP